jgi:hypothetical protein
MNQSNFDAIIDAIIDMDAKQITTLFNKAMEKKGVLIVCGAWREDFDEELEDGGKDKLTDDEWRRFCEAMSPDNNRFVDRMMDMHHEVRTEVITDIRPNIYVEDESEEEDQEMDVMFVVATDEDKAGFETDFNEWISEARCSGYIVWEEGDIGYKWHGVCKFSTTDHYHPLRAEDMVSVVEEFGGLNVDTN